MEITTHYSVPLVLVALLSCSNVFGSDTNLLLNGDVGPVESPLPHWFNSDFTVTYSLIPTADQLMEENLRQRYMRLYTPRNKAEMDAYDAIFHVEADFSVFTDTSLRLLEEATRMDGKPSLLSPPYGAPWTYTWVNSFMVEMSPHDITREINLDNFLITGSWTVDIVDAGLPPILTMFDDYNLEKITGNTHIAMYAKPGSTIWATMKGARDPRGREDPPFMISWRWGEGLVWAIAQDYDREWWGVVPGLSAWDHQVNPVSPDIVLNMLYYSVGRALPDDIAIVHDVRSWYSSLGDSRRLFLSVLEFIERFGADTNPLITRMGKLRELEVLAEDLFWEGRYVESLEPLKQAVEDLKEIENDAIKAKADALFWVYLIEWLSVSAVGMVCGFVLWTIMVRRRLYRDVDATKLVRYGE